MTNPLGQSFGHYRLLRLVGTGGFATVYLGEHLYLGTQAAIKVLNVEVQPEASAAFRAEARTIAHLVHPHIVRVLDFGLQETTPFLVMDYAPHGSLRQHHPTATPLPLETVVSYMTQIGSALHYAHQRQIIHRDIKPENMLLNGHQEVLLSDFGLAMTAPGSALSEPARIAGTLAYMAPEQLRGKPCLASDQYALGIVLYQWLMGMLPFHGSAQQILLHHLTTTPPSLRTTRTDLSPALEAVVFQALAKEPYHRFPSVEAFVIAFQRAVQDGGQPTVNHKETRRSFPPPPPPVLSRTPQHALIGRERELLLIHHLLQERQEPPADAVTQTDSYRPYLSLLGDAGIGKTRLAEEVSREAQHQGWTVLWGRAHLHEQQMPYRLWIDLLRHALPSPSWPWQDITQHPEQYQALLVLLPELAERMPFSSSPPLDDTHEHRQFRIWDALRAILTTMSLSSPLLLVFDDLHWADSASCNLIGYLVRTLTHQRVLLLGTCREPEITETHPLHSLFRSFQQQSLLTKIVLPSLTDEQIGHFVAHLPAPIAHRIQRQAAGNPLFAEELARFASSSDDSQETHPLDDASTRKVLPPAIASVFEQHIALLSPESQKMVSCAAVFGNAFALDLLRGMLTTGDILVDEDLLLTQLEEAMRLGLLTEESRGAQIHYHFWHPLLASYLYERVSATRRASFHRRAARVLQESRKEEEAAAIVYHLVRGGTNPSLLVHYATLAGDYAYKLAAYPEAEKHYRMALHHMNILPDDANAGDVMQFLYLLENMGECTLILGQFDEARHFYEQVLDLHGKQSYLSTNTAQQEAQYRTVLWCLIGKTWRHIGKYHQALECLRHGEAALTLREREGGPAWARLRFEQSYTYRGNGQFLEALELARASLQGFLLRSPQTEERSHYPHATLAQRILQGDPVDLGRIYNLLAMIEVNLGQNIEGFDHFTQALAIFERYESKTELVNVCCNLADLYLRKAEYALAQPLFMRSYILAQEIGFAAVISIAAGNLGVVAIRLGNLAEAETWCRKALAALEQVQERLYMSLLHSYLAMILVEQGKLDQAVRLLLHALKMSHTWHLPLCTDFALVVLSHLRIAQARTHQKETVRTHFLKKALSALQHTHTFEERDTETRVEEQVTQTEVFWLLGAFGEAQQQARLALAAAQKYELVWLEARAQHLLGTILTASGEREEGETQFGQALDHLQHYGMRLEYARALRNYGTVLMHQHPIDDTQYRRGRTYLEQALQRFLECQALQDAEGVQRLFQ